MADIAKMIEEIKGMTVLELNDLVKAFILYVFCSELASELCIVSYGNTLIRNDYHTVAVLDQFFDLFNVRFFLYPRF